MRQSMKFTIHDYDEPATLFKLVSHQLEILSNLSFEKI